MHRSCPLHFVFSPLLLDHVCRLFLHTRGSEDLTLRVKRSYVSCTSWDSMSWEFMKNHPVIQDLKQKLTTLQLPAYCSPCFLFSLMNSSKYSKFEISHSSTSLSLQTDLPGSPARPGLRLVQTLSDSSPLLFTTCTSFKTSGDVSCQTSAQECPAQLSLNALVDQLPAGDSDDRDRRSRNHVSSSNIPLLAITRRLC